jgi:hypothetical protein
MEGLRAVRLDYWGRENSYAGYTVFPGIDPPSS